MKKTLTIIALTILYNINAQNCRTFIITTEGEEDFNNYNTSSGYQTLSNNFIGSNNTASGYQALYNNYEGSNNTASGCQALYNNYNGSYNTASGFRALYSNT